MPTPTLRHPKIHLPRTPHLTLPNPLILLLKKELPLPKRRLQIIQPNRLLIKLREKRLLRPLRVPALQELQHEDLAVARDLRDARDGDLAWTRGHGGPVGFAGGAGEVGFCVCEDVEGAGEGHGEVVVGAGVALDEPGWERGG